MRNARIIPSLLVRRGYTVLEVLVSMMILITGIMAIIGFFPMQLRQNRYSMDVTTAVYLAQMKAEEIRRDNDRFGFLIRNIRGLRTPTSPLRFGQDPRFAYQLCGVSLVDTVNDPGDPRDDPNVARVIVRYDTSYRKDAEILYELRFDD
jgi:type II secretory pathway pseudopilin PulG